MKSLISISIAISFITKMACGQTTNCTDAIAQLQDYATQVNQMYNYEYWTAIPNQRCPAVDAWGRPFNPQVVQNCRWQMLGSLNQWYGQQSNYVNNTYLQIARGCVSNPTSSTRKPGPRPTTGDVENKQINTDEIEDLTAGVDEEKAIKITIPSTATGFKPR